MKQNKNKLELNQSKHTIRNTTHEQELNKSQTYSSSTQIKRSRVPNVLIERLKKGVLYLEQNPKNQNVNKNVTWSQNISNKIKQFTNVSKCDICQSEFNTRNNNIYISKCAHKSNFCESCLHHYTIYKVKNFQQVYCPYQQCNSLIDTQAEFFRNLPSDIQRIYRKIHLFYAAAKINTVKMCPKQNCQGFIHLQIAQYITCNKCFFKFCPKCLLEAHAGECLQHELQFFQSNLHYRQCQNCKMVIQKNQGCNHMICRCKHEFCYVCGAAWDPAHYGKHDQNGNPISALNRPNQDHQSFWLCFYDGSTCDCGCCTEESCVAFCNSTSACIIKFPLKILLIAIIVTLNLLILLIDVFTTILILGMTLLIGVCLYSFVIICQQEEAIKMALLIIFFPFTLFLGIWRGLNEFCYPLVSDLFIQFWENMSSCFGRIYSM